MTEITKFKSEGAAGCKAQSWSPEVVSLYGDRQTVIEKLGNFDMDLPNRRIYMFLLETEQNAELALFEESAQSKYRVSRWKGTPRKDLRQSVDEAIIQNKGVACVGEQTKAIVKKLPELRDEGEIPAPATGAAAFSHAIRGATGDYVRTTIYLLC
jgi:hypothetical protein